MFITPSGATTKKLLDGTIDPNNIRPTADFSWPVYDVPLAEWVTEARGLMTSARRRLSGRSISCTG
jgi:hypothetical protein